MDFRSQRVLKLLQRKYREDPVKFRRFLPGVVELLPEENRSRRRSASPFGLTENERSRNREELADILRKLSAGTLPPEEAWVGLRQCAVLVEDGDLSYGWQEYLSHDFNNKVLNELLRVALGKLPRTFKKKTVVKNPRVNDGRPAETITMVKGICLDLDPSRRLMSINVNPGEYRNRGKMLSIVALHGGSTILPSTHLEVAAP